MQDYNYVHSNALEITLEISCCKHPPASHLATYWIDNKNALLAYMEKTNTGVKGLVTDSRGMIYSYTFTFSFLANYVLGSRIG